MSTRFYFGDDSIPTSQTPTSLSITTTTTLGNENGDANERKIHDDYDNDDDNDDYNDTSTLPFPKPLSRPTFTTPDFEPHAFLASLRTSNRFQTLEDLQAELRELSATINKELVDLVNGNYEEFVSLGTDLRGGDEKVEEVRVGLLGFEKDVTALREKVVGRRREVADLVREKKQIRKDVGLGRGLLEIDERLTELEERFEWKERDGVPRTLKGGGIQGEDEEDGEGMGMQEKQKWSDDWDEESMGESDQDEEEDDDGENGGEGEGVVSGRARRLVEQYLIVNLLVKKHGQTHPFLVSQRERIRRVHERVRIEVETAIKATDRLATKQKLIQLRSEMDE